MELQKICNKRIAKEFSPGDVLECVANDNNRFYFGERLIVRNIYPDEWVVVEFIDHRKTFYPGDFRKVSS